MLALFLSVALWQDELSRPLIESGVRLSDGFEFGVESQSARDLWLLSSRHANVMRESVTAANNPCIVAQWEMECQWRARAWDLLDNVLYHPLPIKCKRENLELLRQHIGDEAYANRWMPSPTPTYRGQ